MGLGLTRKLQLEAFAGVGAVGDELQPHAAGRAVDAGAEHLGAAEGAQQASRAIAAIVHLAGTRNTEGKTCFICYFRDQTIHKQFLWSQRNDPI